MGDVLETRIIPEAIAARQPPGVRTKIPRIIFQTFKTATVTPAMWAAARSWSDVNPDFEYRFFDDEACRAALEADFGRRARDAFDALPAGAFRADLWRYCALAIHGGVYADIDTVCKRPLQELIRAEDEFIVARGERPWFLFNAFICSVPGHAFLLGLIERAIDLVLKGDLRPPFEIVGPAALGGRVNTAIGRAERAPIALGMHRENGFSFRILRKLVWPAPFQRPGRTHDLFRTRVLDGFRTVFLCKYEGYVSDLEALGIEHWSRGQPDPRLGPW